MQQPEPVGRSLLNATAVFLAAGLFGLFGLPAVFGTAPERDLALLWLALAFADCVCLLPPIRPIVSALAAQLKRLPGMRGAQPTGDIRTSRELARLLAAAGYLVLFQAVLRHPLVAVFGAGVDPFLVEASFTILALLALLALLGWVYAVARPLLEGMAWLALDSALATTETVISPEPHPTEAEIATVVSPHPSVNDERTEVAPTDVAPTEVARTEIASDATEVQR